MLAINDRVRNSGHPAMLAICVGNDQNRHCHVGASKDNWPPDTWLMELGLTIRKEEKRPGHDVLKHVCQTFKSRIDSGKHQDKRRNVLDATLLSPVVSLPNHTAQAFRGSDYICQDRCICCRGTFGFNWASKERELGDLGLNDIKVFENYLTDEDIHHQNCGKCAEFVLWLRCLGKIPAVGPQRQPISSFNSRSLSSLAKWTNLCVIILWWLFDKFGLRRNR